MGMMTINPANDELAAYWFDNYRGTYKGTGKREGMKIVTTWESPMGSETRVIEKVSDDKMVMTFKGKDPTGKEIEGRTELTRTKMAGKS